MESKNSIKKSGSDVITILEKKINHFRDIIQKTFIHLNSNKLLGILTGFEVSAGILLLKTLNDDVKDVYSKIHETETDTIIQKLQVINNNLSSIMKTYGTQTLDDLITVCYGCETVIYNNEHEKSKYELLKKYFHPTNYKLLNTLQKKMKKENNEKIPLHLECQDISTFATDFHTKVFGMKIHIMNENQNKQFVVYGVIDDVVLDFINNKYINYLNAELRDNLPKEVEFNEEYYVNFLSYLILKDYLIFSCNEIYQKYMGIVSQYKLLKQKSLEKMIKDFISCDLFSKRNTILLLLINCSENNSTQNNIKLDEEKRNCENKYIAYLLYDLLSNESNQSVDSEEQIMLLSSLPYHGKRGFREAMKNTVQYTQELTNFNMNKIPLEQQICLLKVNDAVKEKAIMKLKEVKSKSDDSGSKARQYLDGLLKIPFEVYRKEPILFVMNEARILFKGLVDKIRKNELDVTDEVVPLLKCKYTNMEIMFYLRKIKEYISDCERIKLDTAKIYLTKGDKNVLLQNINKLEGLNSTLSTWSKKSKSVLREKIIDIINNLKEVPSCVTINSHQQEISLVDMKEGVKNIEDKMKCISDYMSELRKTLDKCVYGHKNAKKQIERIIGQWINGEQGGYCFGFEGPPGVGKTSLAKRGLSDCLKDENGICRPFAMIQMGGDSSGSTLHGHNYTYVGSSWGSIVQILMDKKCMNPIIFIDEIDKISKTEHGKEIVGILIHLLDNTQNDCFQDKYFSGVDLDLSKALFILSYNDIDQIDRILLDRIHRVKFSNLNLEDKLTISKTHILPEVFEKMGLQEMIVFSDEVLKFVIEDYTCEAGVRKLKEILFEIVGEINLELLNLSFDTDERQKRLPLVITKEDIKKKYFKEKREIKIQKIHKEPQIGIINGLWANDLGLGGALPIQAKFFPSSQFLELKLTGMVGDVMKESANVALSIAWNLTPVENKEKMIEKYSANKNNIHGIHVHFPDGSTHKNGPSGGSCLTVVLYSLLNDIKIKNDIAMTGEISLEGKITEIGGLDLKILGGIKAGVKTFIYPYENSKDLKDFMEKSKENDLLKGIEFYSVENINEVFPFIFL